jgi:hypothetical protein
MIVYNLIEVQKICNNASMSILIDLQNNLMVNAPEIIFEFGAVCYQKMVTASNEAIENLITLNNVQE